MPVRSTTPLNAGGHRRRRRKSSTKRRRKSSQKKRRRSRKSSKKKRRRRRSRSLSAGGLPKYPTAKTRAGKYRAVFEGRALMTGPGGLKKADLMLNAGGKVVSKRQSSRPLNAYMKLVQKARSNGWEEFEYNDNTYYRDYTKTGMAIFRKA